MYAIGEVKQGGLFAVASIMHRAIKDFNFYVEYEAFMKGRTSVEKEEVLAWMDTLGKPVEQSEENQKEYLALSHKEQQAVDFQFSGEAMPSHAGLEFLNQRFPTIANHADHYEIATIAANLNFDTNVGQVHEIIEALGQREGEPGIRGALKEVVLAINIPKAQAEQARIIEQYGYAISPVYAENAEGMNRVYTINGRNKFGFELFCVQGHADLDLLCSLLGCVIALHEEGTPILEVNGAIATMADDTKMRYQLVEADPVAAQALGHFGDFKEGDRLIQLVLADNKNLLPDEEGYNIEHFKQPVFAMGSKQPAADASLPEGWKEAFDKEPSADRGQTAAVAVAEESPLYTPSKNVDAADVVMPIGFDAGEEKKDV